jgi:DNA polymerase III subunit epsilon
VVRFGRRRSATAERYLNAQLPVDDTHWRDAPYCVVDVETTGLDLRRDEVISYAAVPIDDARIRVGGAIEGLVRPRRLPDRETIVIHGILPGDLRDAPTAEEAAERLQQALTGRVMVAHSAWVERGFLRRIFRRTGVRFREPVIDTHDIGRLALYLRSGRLPPAISLTTLAGALGLPAYRPHHAMGDALTTGQVFLAAASILDAVERESVATLAAGGRRVADRMAYEAAP